MRRTFQFHVLIAIALCAVAGSAFAADGVSWSSGINLTEKESSMTMGSRIEAFCGDNLVGSWLSSTNQLPQLVTGLQYAVYSDFSGLKSVQEVELSPDHGKTCWKARLVPGKGYSVDLPDLAPGSYALEWGVRSRDQRNRVIILIIPINWSSSRNSSSVNQMMVQQAPRECGSYDDRMWFSCLRGFVPAWATPDPSFLAQQQAVKQMTQPVQPVASTPPPVAQLAPLPSAPHAKAPLTRRDSEEADDGYLDQPVQRSARKPERDHRVSKEMRDEHEEPAPVPNFSNGTKIFLGHMENGKFCLDRTISSRNFRAMVRVNDFLVFGGNAEAKVIGVDPSRKTITAIVDVNDWVPIKSGDAISVRKGEEQ